MAHADEMALVKKKTISHTQNNTLKNFFFRFKKLFRPHALPFPSRITAEDEAAGSRMVKLLVNFAKVCGKQL